MQRCHVEDGVRREVGHRTQVGCAPDIAVDHGQRARRAGMAKVRAPAEAEIVDDQDVVPRVQE
jgi:hypothetical protein